MSSVHRDDWLTDENWKPRDATWTDKDGLTHTLRGYRTTTCGISCRGGVYTDWMNNCLLCIGHVD